MFFLYFPPFYLDVFNVALCMQNCCLWERAKNEAIAFIHEQLSSFLTTFLEYHVLEYLIILHIIQIPLRVFSTLINKIENRINPFPHVDVFCSRRLFENSDKRRNYSK